MAEREPLEATTPASPFDLFLRLCCSPPQRMAADLYDLPSKEFSLERVIAEGSFGIVRMCRRRSNNELLAAKIPKNSICTPIEVWTLCSLLYNWIVKARIPCISCLERNEFWTCVVSADAMHGSVDETQIRPAQYCQILWYIQIVSPTSDGIRVAGYEP